MSNARENVNLLTSMDWDIATLRLANWGSGAVPPQVVLKQNWSAGDGGGLFRYDASDTTTADNSGTVIVDAAGNRWKRQYEDGYFFASWWNVKGNATDCTANWNIMWVAVNALGGGVIYLDAGTTLLTGQAVCNGSFITVSGQNGNDTGGPSTLQSTYTAGPAFLIGGTLSSTFDITFQNLKLYGAPSQVFFQQRYHRSFTIDTCSTFEMSTLVKIGDVAAAGPAYFTTIKGGSHAAYLPRITISAGSGTFQANETISGGGWTAKVRFVNGPVITLTGTDAATPSGTLTGGTSGATATSYVFTRGSHYIDVVNSAGGLFAFDMQAEGSYDKAVNGIEFSNNIYSPFDQIEIYNNYLARFNRNINQVDVRVGNETIYNNRLDEGIEWAINWETTSATTKPISQVGWAGVISNNTIGTLGKGIRLANSRSTAGQDSGDTTLSGLHTQAMLGPAVTLLTAGGGQIRNTTVRGVHAIEHETGTNLISVTAGGAGDLPGTSVDEIHTNSAILHAVNVVGSPNSSFRVGYNITAPNRSGNLVNGTATRLPTLNEQGLAITETAANIAAVGNAINTTGKYIGKAVYDTTNNRLMIASGTAAASPWYVADGSASVTPS